MFSILVVESEGLITELLQEALKDEEYQVIMIPSNDDAVQFVLREIPVLVVLDVTAPSGDTYQVVQRLRDHPKSMHIPIVVISSFNTPTDRVRALELGVDGYISTPFDNHELLAHVRRQLSRVQQTSLSPLTHLPGGLQLERAIDYKLKSLDAWSVLYLDLDNFKAFNDVYGFLAGNDMILLVGDICQRTVYEYGNSDDFVGHVGGDDFVIVTTPDREQMLYERILERYKRESVVLYREDDLARGSISGVDRKGRPYQFPLVSLSIGVVRHCLRCSHSIDDVGILAAEAKLRAKQSPDNVFCISSQRDHSTGKCSFWRRLSPPFDMMKNLGPGLHHFSEEDAFAEI